MNRIECGLQAIFGGGPRTQGWLEVIAALAEAQAETGLIPAEVVPEIRRVCRVELLDMAAIHRGYQESGHSTMGLIRELKRHCSSAAGEWLYYGATVHDITDTWLAIALLKVWANVFRDLRDLEVILLDLALTHRDTPMPGRTHGQPGLPITFGFKVVVWVREVRRHIDRLKDIRPRLGRGELAGGVGSLSSFGERGFEVQERFFAKLGLRPPDIVWNTARDTLVDFINLLAMMGPPSTRSGRKFTICSGRKSGRFGRVLSAAPWVASRCPTRAPRRLGSLARLIRHNAACLAENLVHDHERDGRSWKAEWGLIGPTCAMAGALLRLVRTMCANLQVDEAGMWRNLEASRDFVLSEGVMLALAQKVGKQSAHEIVYSTAMAAFEADRLLQEVVLENEQITAHLSPAEIDRLFDYRQQLGLCPEFVDRVVTMTECDRAGDEIKFKGDAL